MSEFPPPRRSTSAFRRATSVWRRKTSATRARSACFEKVFFFQEVDVEVEFFFGDGPSSSSLSFLLFFSLQLFFFRLPLPRPTRAHVASRARGRRPVETEIFVEEEKEDEDESEAWISARERRWHARRWHQRLARDPREKSASASRFFLNAVLQQLPHTHLVRHAGEKRRSDKRRSGRGPRFYFFFSRPAILTFDVVFAFALFFSLSTLSSERERGREKGSATPPPLALSALAKETPSALAPHPPDTIRIGGKRRGQTSEA